MLLNDGANTVSMYTVDSCSGTLTSATGGNAFGSESMAVDPGGATPEQFVGIIKSDVTKFSDVVKAAHLTFEE